jgi:hypothetical protein
LILSGNPSKDGILTAASDVYGSYHAFKDSSIRVPSFTQSLSYSISRFVISILDQHSARCNTTRPTTCGIPIAPAGTVERE